MYTLKKNKEFIMEYIHATSGNHKTRELLEKYNRDPGLVDNILFMESVFPKYEVLVDEILAEGDRVMVRARLRGRHDGEFLGIPPTHKEVEAPNVFNILKSFIDKILAFTNKSDIKRVGVSQFDFIKERLKCILLKNKNEYSSCP